MEYFNNSIIKIRNGKYFANIMNTLSSTNRKKFILLSSNFMLNASNIDEEIKLKFIIESIQFSWLDDIIDFISEELHKMPDLNKFKVLKFGKHSSSNTLLIDKLCQNNVLNNKCIVDLHCSQAINPTDNYLLIDDFCATGKTIYTNIEDLKLTGKVKCVCYFMTELAINRIKEKRNDIDIKFCANVITLSDLKLELSTDIYEYIKNKEEFFTHQKDYYMGTMVSIDFKSPNNNLSLLYKKGSIPWNNLLFRKSSLIQVLNSSNQAMYQHLKSKFNYLRTKYDGELKKLYKLGFNNNDFYKVIEEYIFVGYDFNKLNISKREEIMVATILKIIDSEEEFLKYKQDLEMSKRGNKE